MARSVASDRRLTPYEYLEWELSSPVKHEYVAGQVYPMVGASLAHNMICGNAYMILRQHLRGTPCRVFMGDVKARIEAADAFYYPDLMVSCELSGNEYYREAPVLIVEVLSPSTAKFDSGEKRRDFQRLDSLREYVLISQDCMDVRVWQREESGWRMNVYTDGMVIPLRSVEVEIPIERIYDEVWD